MIKLSICIPSYNRALFLPTLLQSIVSQYSDEVEIVICDNGSTDNTQEVATSWQKKYPRISYERFPINQGPDRCFLRSVEMAQGIFCWLMGDDDILEKGALQKVLHALNTYPDLSGITVSRAAYNFSLTKRWIEPDVKQLKEDTFFTSDVSCLTSVLPLLGFLSAQVVRKEYWIEIAKEEGISKYFNAYVLVYIIGRMIQKRPNWLLLKEPCVGWRSENDSFARQLGAFGRFKLDLNGYQTILQGLCQNNQTLYRKWMSQITSQHLFAHIRHLKLKGFLKGIYFETLCLCISKLRNIPVFWYKLLPILVSPAWLLKRLRPIYHRIKQS